MRSLKIGLFTFPATHFPFTPTSLSRQPILHLQSEWSFNNDRSAISQWLIEILQWLLSTFRKKHRVLYWFARSCRNRLWLLLQLHLLKEACILSSPFCSRYTEVPRMYPLVSLVAVTLFQALSKVIFTHWNFVHLSLYFGLYLLTYLLFLMNKNFMYLRLTMW